MEFKTREDIKHFILEIERTFPVNDWKFDDIHLWPYIRINLFLNLCGDGLMKKSNLSGFTKNKSIQKSIPILKPFRKFYDLLNYFFWSRTFEQKSYIFNAQERYRINFQGKRYNRFFDSLIEQKKIGRDYYFIETPRSDENILNSDMIIGFEERFKIFLPYYFLINRIKRRRVDVKINGYELLIQYLKDKKIANRFCVNFSSEAILETIRIDFLPRMAFYEMIFERVKPKQAYILCYYNDLSFVLVANRRNIETIEFQHGAQTDEHLCYGNWTKIPDKGYDMLPRTFWSWDLGSMNCIANWASKNPLYKYFVGGNTWINFWEDKKNVYEYEGFVLYSLQPRHGFNVLFPKILIDFIKTKKLKWFIRLHPAMINQYAEFEAFFIKEDIFHLINFNEANELPLPLLLKKCLIHVTNSSGTTIEAALLSKKTIVVHEVGETYYKKLISDGIVKYIPIDERFEERFYLFLNKYEN